jgi:lipopolysaccharide biosynthesis glycosyltransferase
MDKSELEIKPSANACVCYLSDEGYLFPSLLSAIQIRKHVSPQKADVVMYYFGEPTSKSETFREIYLKCGLRFVRLPKSTIEQMPAMFARLFLDRFLEPEYQRILYIDGDTQVVADIEPLFDVELPPNKFCAVRDPTALAIECDRALFPEQAAYFESIGIGRSQVGEYSNSGVLLLDRTSWAALSADCLRLLKARKDPFRFPDQDLINLTANGRCLTMSFKWNFPVFLMNYGFEPIIDPRIYHFMSNPRPWQGSFPPWGPKWQSRYSELVREFPGLKPYFVSLPPAKHLKYYLQQHYKKVVEGRFWQRPDVHSRIIEIEKNAFI